MYKILICVFLACGANAALAIPSMPEGGFYKIDKIPWAPKNLKKSSKGVFRIGANDFRCGSVSLSNSGYAATALHCLNPCLFDRSEKPLVKMDLYERPEYYKAFKIAEGESLKCSPEFFGNNLASIRLNDDFQYEYAVKKPKIVWFGKGKSNHYEDKVTEISQKEFDSFKDLTEDVVIVKYDDVDLYGKEKLPCIPLAKQAIEDDDPVWNIGFPYNNGRYKERLRMEPLISQGYYRNTIEKDPIYKHEYAGVLSASQQKLFWQREMRVWNQPHVFLSSADTYSGNSGGAAVNSNGELVAIVYGVTKLSDDNYEGSSSIGFDALALKERVADELGDEQAEAIFNCSN